MKQCVLTLTIGVAAGLALSSCGGSSPAAPGPNPSPVPTATPVPVASPTPTPLSSIDSSTACGAPLQPFIQRCDFVRKRSPQYYSQVLAAIATLRKEKPALFEYSGPNQKDIHVIRRDGYMTGVTKILARDYNLCAIWPLDGYPANEFNVKADNSYSETWNILNSWGLVWWNLEAQCSPSVF